jgi:hypothetical protein
MTITYERVRWLESALGLTAGERINAWDRSNEANLFSGVFIARGGPIFGGDEGVLGGSPIIVERAIYLSEKLVDPLSQYAVALHEFYHMTRTVYNVSSPQEESGATSYAIDVLSIPFGRPLAEAVFKLVVEKRLHQLENFPGLHTMLANSPNPHQRIVAAELEKYLKTWHPPSSHTRLSGKVLGSRKSFNKNERIRIR